MRKSVDMGEQWTHLAFVFSSPLVRKTDKELMKWMKIDYRTEISDIEKDLR